MTGMKTRPPCQVPKCTEGAGMVIGGKCLCYPHAYKLNQIQQEKARKEMEDGLKNLSEM